MLVRGTEEADHLVGRGVEEALPLAGTHVNQNRFQAHMTK